MINPKFEAKILNGFRDKNSRVGRGGAILNYTFFYIYSLFARLLHRVYSKVLKYIYHMKEETLFHRSSLIAIVCGSSINAESLMSDFFNDKTLRRNSKKHPIIDFPEIYMKR
jgi:hypothetical protein